MRASELLLLLVAACGSPAKKPLAEPTRPDETCLARETRIDAKEARIVLSSRWKASARLEAISVVDAEKPNTKRATGGAEFKLKGLRVRAQTITVTWIDDPAHDSFLLYATTVALFHQKRDRPYHSTDLSAVTMADDQVSFFQQ